MTALLTIIGIGFIHSFADSFPNHLITTIYCFSIIPIFIFGIFHKWQPRVIAAVVTLVVAIIFAIIPAFSNEAFETYRNSYSSTDGAILDLKFGANPIVATWSGTGKGEVIIIDAGDGAYTLKLIGNKGADYYFKITDDSEKEYEFHYYFSKEENTVILEQAE
jgi:hypothetical protein